MLSVVATPALPESGSNHQAPSQHQYGTRIRSNSVIKPSPRLRQSPDPLPRRIKPAPVAKAKASVMSKEPTPVQMPMFPPANVMLHSDDATSKVFLAIGRSFVSVDNKAMTIKDLAEMTMKFGLVCQNVSAAGQAITTYIRNHLQRCEIQKDHPLLLRHVLSGTPSDDDLVSALYSRSGGAHCSLSPGEKRVTNFRRGTVVWYLSRATGIPCPFSRAGIRLCDYTENGKVGITVNPGKERKRERDRMRRAEQSGQKRKRLPRACAARPGSDSESSEEEEQPPPKVKLMLRLKPSLAYSSSASPSLAQSSSPSDIVDLSTEPDLDDEITSDSSLDDEEPTQAVSLPYPVYPRPPPGTCASIGDASPSFPPVPFCAASPYSDRSWRSPSIPCSATSASPPPDSEMEEEEEEDEDEDEEEAEEAELEQENDDEDVDMTAMESSSFTHDPAGYDSPAWEDEDDLDLDDDYDTQWGESPGPTSPPAHFEDDIQVKQEPQDVGSILAAWEHEENLATQAHVLDIVAKACASQYVPPEVKTEEDESWLWHNFRSPCDEFVYTVDGDTMRIKQEEEEIMLPPMEYDPTSPILSPATAYSSLPASSTPYDSPVVESCTPSRYFTEPPWQDVELLGPDSVKLKDLDDGIWQIESSKQDRKSRADVVKSDAPAPCLRPAQPVEPHKIHERLVIITRSQTPPTDASESSSERENSRDSVASISSSASQAKAGDSCSASTSSRPVVVRTCEPCNPSVCATELEGIPVYEITLGSSVFLRRVDTDFVNISPMLCFFDMSAPDMSATQWPVLVNRGSLAVCGTWVPLASAQTLFRDQDSLSVFLSDDLHQRFPPALQDFHTSSSHERSLVRFGPNFQSTQEAKKQFLGSFRVELPARPVYNLAGEEEDPIPESPWDAHWHLLHLQDTPLPAPEEAQEVPETPLSPAEEEMFHVLCSIPDWEDSESPASPPPPPPASLPLQPLLSPPQPIETPRTEAVPCRERPLRRSRRVIPGVVNRPRTRSVAKTSKSKNA
ncbi:uncharacterized protein PHACADRAFT_256425 [Phanerochaete carnosa HHB-10118-sp]|uniref:GDS1 winged helix domain-containing protein n=1 Tax=Phanerochaete carnosa (strain HHB-10118-sp) TaxID=650164 RepID=K5W8W2_PHACS|nr:uncharacterized protein PHACADRAFT_256425 [Phanerochaete carnosa HHB-10118-sp]EKM55650.1 hypothetical protein PHACADRAFT_256425 [Phanerochaete carnosa HHB-10118-sp]